jgi:hypothetical protein
MKKLAIATVLFFNCIAAQAACVNGVCSMSNEKLYEATVRLPGVGTQKVSVRADSEVNARALLASQYGRENIVYVASGR